MSSNFSNHQVAGIKSQADLAYELIMSQARDAGVDEIEALDGLIAWARECIALAEETKEQIQKERQK